MGLVHSDQAVAAGVQKMYSHSLFLAEEPDPFWANTVHGFRRMSKSELELFSKPVDWPSIQAAAAAAVASRDSSDTPGDGNINSFAAAERASSFADGYTFNTVSLYMLVRLIDRLLCSACISSVCR